MDATPRKDEVDLVRLVARTAVVEGKLALKPFRVRWHRDGLWPTVRGFVDRTEPVSMFLRVEQPRRDLVETIFHELAHVADVQDPGAAHLPTGELERWAEAFAQKMMSRWRGE